jgi:hypothetical protein
MITVTMLIYTISLKFQSPPRMMIHNQCSNTELASPVYFGNGVTCPKLSDQQIDIGTATKICFVISTDRDDFEGALLFELQRYFDTHYDMDESTTETDKREEKCIQMLVAWKVEDSKLFARLALVEHATEFIWNENKLEKLYYENCGWLKKHVNTTSSTWIIDDSTVLKTTFRVRDFEGKFDISISISEEENDGYAMRPIWVDTER